MMFSSVRAVMELRLSDFDYELPESQIAQEPPKTRDGGKLLYLPRVEGDVRYHQIVDLPELLPVDSLVIVNDSRVIPARIEARRQTGGSVEILLLEPLAEQKWWAIVNSSKAPKKDELLLIEKAGQVIGEAKVLSEVVKGRAEISFDRSLIEKAGAMPLPPYIKRPANTADAERYQTVYSKDEGSVAAPTAGLHFTDELLARVQDRGIEVKRVTLHVGPGTFMPVRHDNPDEHQMEEERYTLSEETADAIAKAKAEGRKVIAVGTTVVRTLESSEGKAGSGRTRLFIRPGRHLFKVVDGLMTNFHLPKSTLLMLVSAFATRERVLDAYQKALDARYRFYSYGDAMLIL